MSAFSMAKKATVQKLASFWTAVSGADQELAVDFRPLTAPVPLKVQAARHLPTYEQPAKARIIRVDCYLG